MPETLQEYSKDAAEAFIQTAVFIDDRIYQKPEATVGTANPPQTREPAANTENHNRATTTQPLPPKEAVSDSYEIINSFAKKKIVCSMYEPKNNPDGSETNSIIPLCTAVDIVIVDWNLHGDRGDKAIDLIRSLISQAIQDAPEQIRLVLVYTQEPKLGDVAGKIFNAIQEHADIQEHANIKDLIQPNMDTNDLAFYNESYRVAVLGKPGRERADIDPRSVVSETALADIAVEEFAKLAQGLLQAAILLGLAKIRNNSRKILSRFDHQLDPAFLTHRAMALDTEDALSHIVPLLISEIESVLEDAIPNLQISDDVLRDWCMNVWEPKNHIRQDYGIERDYKQIAADICTKGFKTARKRHNTGPNPGNKRYVMKAGEFLLPSRDSDANLRFAQFMANRTFYGGSRRVLTLGSVLQYREQDEEQDRYILCIQPVCDCVRLKTPTVFIFAELKADEEATEGSLFLIVKPEPPVIKLTYTPNSYRCLATTFVPDEESRMIVSKANETNICFEDNDGQVYNWIDQLRPSHAQRAVEKFASNLSRVGLSESEWLRSLARK